MTSILITGVNGFIGDRYASSVRQKGWHVVGLDLQPADLHGHCDEYHSVDLGASEASAFFDTLPGVDLVLHAGGVSGFMVATDRPHHIVDVNIRGTMPVLHFACQRQIRRTVLCSTMMVYSADAQLGLRHSEEEYPAPISVYGASKVAIEALMHGYNHQYGIDAIAVRPGHVYGPGRTTQCFVREMLKAVRMGTRCEIPQSGKSWRQYVHVDDICDALDRAFSVVRPVTRTFNITAGEIHTLDEVAAIINRNIGKLDVVFDSSIDLPNYRVGELSIERARDTLGFVPSRKLVTGLRSYWDEAFATKAPKQ